MPLATLSIDLVAKLAKFERDMGAAARASEATAARIETAFAFVGGALKGAFAGGALTATVAYFRAVNDGVDKLNDLRDATGASVEKLSALEDIAARNGTKFESVAQAVVKFNNTLKEANNTNAQGSVFKALGLDVAQLKKLDPAEALLKTAEAFQMYAADGDAARAVQELFGKSIQEVAPFLKDLAEAGTLNATVTAKQAEEAEKFNKALFALQKNTLDASRAVTGDLVVGLNTLIDRFRAGAKEGEHLLETILKLTSPAYLLFGSKGPTKNGFTEAREELERIDKLISKIDVSRTNDVGVRFLLRQRAEAQDRLNSYLGGAGGAGRGKVNPDFVKPQLEVKDVSDDAAMRAARFKLLKSQAEQLLSIEREGLQEAMRYNDFVYKVGARDVEAYYSEKIELELASLDVQKKALEAEMAAAAQRSAGAEKGSERVAAQAAQVELQTKLIQLAGQRKVIEEQARDAIIRGAQRLAAAVAEYDRGTQAVNLNLYQQQKTLEDMVEEESIRRRYAGEINADTKIQLALLDSKLAKDRQQLEYQLMLSDLAEDQKNKLRETFELYGQISRRSVGELKREEFQKGISESVSSGLAQALRDGKNPVKAFATSLGDAVLDAMTRSIATALVDAIGFGPKGIATTAIGGFFSKLFSFESGGIMTAAGSVPLKKYASGGVANSPQLALYGEGSRPEAYVPLPDGRRIPVAMQGGGGGQVVINQYFTVGDIATKSDLQKSMAMSRREMAAAVQRARTYGAEA